MELAVTTPRQTSNIRTSIGPGAVLGGFRLVELLGQGGMGTVFRAQNTRVGRMTRAVKVIHSELANDPEFRQRFLREVECLEVLQHQNIVRVENVGEESGALFMVMELLSGECASALLARRNGQLPLEVAAAIIGQALEGIAVAHGQGIIHRDLKPPNLFVSVQGGVKILDFGIARYRDIGGQLTRAGNAAPGSPAYYAPEFVDGAAASPASDIYALGISLFELATGRLPYQAGGGTDGQAALSLLMQHATKPLPDPRTIRADLPEQLIAVLQRATAKKPEERYPDAQSFARDLLPLVAGCSLLGIAEARSSGTWDTGPTSQPSLASPLTRPEDTGPKPLSTQFDLPAPSQPRPATPSQETSTASRVRVRWLIWTGMALAFVLSMGGVYWWARATAPKAPIPKSHESLPPTTERPPPPPPPPVEKTPPASPEPPRAPEKRGDPPKKIAAGGPPRKEPAPPLSPSDSVICQESFRRDACMRLCKTSPKECSDVADALRYKHQDQEALATSMKRVACGRGVQKACR